MKCKFSYEDENSIHTVEFEIKDLYDNFRKGIITISSELSKEDSKKVYDWCNAIGKSINKNSNYTGIKDFIKNMNFYNHLENKKYNIENINDIDVYTLNELCLLSINEFDIKFDFENILMEDNDMNGIYGFQTLPNGMEILGLIAGGDWEIPVNFILYLKNGKLYNYIPKNGNCYNKESNSAYNFEDIIDPLYNKEEMIKEICEIF